MSFSPIWAPSGAINRTRFTRIRSLTRGSAMGIPPDTYGCLVLEDAHKNRGSTIGAARCSDLTHLTTVDRWEAGASSYVVYLANSSTTDDVRRLGPSWAVNPGREPAKRVRCDHRSDGRLSPFVCLPWFRAGNCSFNIADSEDSERDRNSGIELHAHQSLGRTMGDVLVMIGVSFDHRSETHNRVAAGSCKALSHEGNFKSTRCIDLNDLGRTCLLEELDRSRSEARGDSIVEHRGDDTDAETGSRRLIPG